MHNDLVEEEKERKSFSHHDDGGAFSLLPFLFVYSNRSIKVWSERFIFFWLCVRVEGGARKVVFRGVDGPRPPRRPILASPLKTGLLPTPCLTLPSTISPSSSHSAPTH